MTLTSLNVAADDEQIIVEGRRDKNAVPGGQWKVQISRSYRFGKSLDGNNDVRALGRDSVFNFCLLDTQIEPFVRKLVGEGRSNVASTTICRPMQLEIKDGRAQASQVCDGGNVSIPDSKNGRLATYPTRLILNIDGRFDDKSLKLDFESRREFLVADASLAVHPDLMRWSISGERMGECTVGK